nr:hypothetical protein [uncultured Flavobacterium sp.]
MKKIFLIPIICLVFCNCQQLSETFDSTLKPKDSSVKKEALPESKKPSLTEKPSLVQKDSIVQQEIEELKPVTVDFLKKPEMLQKAEDDLRKLPQFMGKEIFIYSYMYFYNDGDIDAKIQNPNNREQVDNYEYRNNEWSKTSPVQLAARSGLKNDLFPLNKIKFAYVAKVAAIYNEKASKIDGAELTNRVYVLAHKGLPRWYPCGIRSAREIYSIEYNIDGSLKKFERI